MEREIWISQDSKCAGVANIRDKKPIFNKDANVYFPATDSLWLGIMWVELCPQVTFESGPKKFKLVEVAE